MNTIRELLKGCQLIKDNAGNVLIQTIGPMQLLGLTAPPEYSIDVFGDPFAVRVSNQRYGHMAVSADQPTIIPAQMGVMTQHGQNHAMVKGAYVPRGRSEFNDAGCIQGSTTGYIREGDNEFVLIPTSMREMLFPMVNHTSGHSNVYPAIDQLGKDTKSNTGYYLDKYFAKYGKKLDTYIAHFERLDKLIGMIVLMNGEIVAVDKFPSYQYASRIWTKLVRDCYGVLPITAEVNGQSGPTSFTDVMSNIQRREDEPVPDYLQRVLDRTHKRLGEVAVDRLAELMEVNFNVKGDRTVTGPEGPVASFVIESDGYIGQAIATDRYNHLVSIVKKRTFSPETARQASRYRNLASSQSEFTI